MSTPTTSRTSYVLQQSVSENDAGGWDFQCPGVVGSPCGIVGGQPFHSDGWPSQETAIARAEEHFEEHKFGYEVLKARQAAAAAAGEDEDPEPVDLEKITEDTGLRPMSSLEEFREKHGLGVNSDGNAVKLGDL